MRLLVRPARQDINALLGNLMLSAGQLNSFWTDEAPRPCLLFQFGIFRPVAMAALSVGTEVMSPLVFTTAVKCQNLKFRCHILI